MEFVLTVEQLVADLKAKNYAKVAVDAGVLIQKIGQLAADYQAGKPLMMACPDAETRLEACRVDLDALHAEHAPRAGIIDSILKVDPHTLVSLVEVALKLVAQLSSNPATA